MKHSYLYSIAVTSLGWVEFLLASSHGEMQAFVFLRSLSLLVLFILLLRHKHAHITRARTCTQASLVHMYVSSTHLLNHHSESSLAVIALFLLLLLFSWHLFHPIGGSWDLLFQSTCPLMHADSRATCCLCLNLIPKKRDFCETWARKSQYGISATHLYQMLFSGSSPLLPLQRRDPLCPQKACRGRRDGPGPSSGRLKGHIYLFSGHIMNRGIVIPSLHHLLSILAATWFIFLSDGMKRCE